MRVSFSGDGNKVRDRPDKITPLMIDSLADPMVSGTLEVSLEV